MAIPKYNEPYVPLLDALRDGTVHAVTDIENALVARMGLTAEEHSRSVFQVVR